jgi:hypothetical protein
MTRVQLPFSRDELLRRTDALITQDGAYKRLDDNVGRLENLFKTFLFTPEYSRVRRSPTAASHFREEKYRSQPYCNALSMENAMSLFLGHYSMHSELLDAPVRIQTKIIYRIEDAVPEQMLIDGIRLVAEGFDRSSILVRSTNVPNQQIREEAQHLANALGITTETCSQALGRVANEMEKWVEFNEKMLTKKEKQAFGEALADYRAALSEVLGYVDYARGYFKQIDTRTEAAHEHHKDLIGL